MSGLTVESAVARLSGHGPTDRAVAERNTTAAERTRIAPIVAATRVPIGHHRVQPVLRNTSQRFYLSLKIGAREALPNPAQQVLSVLPGRTSEPTLLRHKIDRKPAQIFLVLFGRFVYCATREEGVNDDYRWSIPYLSLSLDSWLAGTRDPQILRVRMVQSHGDLGTQEHSEDLTEPRKTARAYGPHVTAPFQA